MHATSAGAVAVRLHALPRVMRRRFDLQRAAVCGVAAACLSAAAGAMLTAQVPFVVVADSARTAPAADERIVYGPAPEQFVELRVPRGRGPHPVVVLMHGGCWSAQYDLSHVAGAAESLRSAGFATWVIEYRRAGNDGGGAPGTFDDVRAAYDMLVATAGKRGLDLDRVVFIGHSAGGHLALWLAAEPGVRVRGVLGLAAVTDLSAFAKPSGCGAGVTRLLGGSPTDKAETYAMFSPVTRAAPMSAVRLLVAQDDRVVPRAQADVYRARFAATPIHEVPGGHFDLVAPWTEAWQQVLAQLRDLLR